jgi:hypothetical protein
MPRPRESLQRRNHSLDPLADRRSLLSREAGHSADVGCSADAYLSGKGAVATRPYVGAAPAMPDDNNVFST